MLANPRPDAQGKLILRSRLPTRNNKNKKGRAEEYPLPDPTLRPVHHSSKKARAPDIPRTCSIRITSQPTTPPTAQMSMVKRLMGIGGIRTRFVTISRTTPTMLFSRRPGIAASPPHIIRTKTINTISTSTANSMNFYLPRLPHLLRPVPGPDTVSAYQVADEPGQQLVPVL